MRIRRTMRNGVTTLVVATLGLLSTGASAQADAAHRQPLPAPSTATGSGPICWYGACYDYVSGRQVTDASGASVRMLQAAPRVKAGDQQSHSLQELALQSTDRKSTVEIGWTVDLGLNGDRRPHLFVYHWVDGAESCYNACGFVPVSHKIKAGMAVRAGTSARFTIRNLAGDWWLFYNEQAVGYFPGSLWHGGFNRAQVITAFGEVAHANGTSCEEMGDGRPGTARGSSWIKGFRLIDSADVPGMTVTSTSPALYDAGRVTHTAFHLGGPGTGPC
ncbi:neprosin family prolyl endopeptidase [Streptomyces sp. NPDC020096]